MTASEFDKLKCAVCYSGRCMADHCPLVAKRADGNKYCNKNTCTEEEIVVSLNGADEKFFAARARNPEAWDIIARYLSTVILE